MRQFLLILVGAVAAGTVALAAEPAPGPGRYAVEPSMDGFVRLDTATGAVSHCGRRDGVWHCDVLAEDASALTAQIKTLSAEIARLSREVSDLRARLALLDGHAGGDRQAALPEDREMDAAMGFAETVMRRLFGMVQELKRESEGGG